MLQGSNVKEAVLRLPYGKDGGLGYTYAPLRHGEEPARRRVMIAPGRQQKRLLWIGIVSVSAALLGLSVACGDRTAGTTPPQAAFTAVASPSITPGPLKLLKVNPEEGPVGIAITVTGDGLPPGKTVDLVWVATNASDMPHVMERFSIGSPVADATGRFTASATALVDHGEFFDIYAIVDGENLAKGVFRVPGAI